MFELGDALLRACRVGVRLMKCGRLKLVRVDGTVRDGRLRLFFNATRRISCAQVIEVCFALGEGRLEFGDACACGRAQLGPEGLLQTENA